MLPFFPTRYGYGGGMVGRLLIAGVMALVVSGATAYIVRSIKVAGRAEAEIRQLTRINEQNRLQDRRRQAALDGLEQATSQARQRLAELNARVERERRQIDEIQASAGEAETCPIECRLP